MTAKIDGIIKQRMVRKKVMAHLVALSLSQGLRAEGEGQGAGEIGEIEALEEEGDMMSQNDEIKNV